MPYRFKLDEPVLKGFRRIAREQFDHARAELGAAHVLPGGVHACRKSIKRLRALVRMAAPALGRRTAERYNAALREVAALLATRRDKAVLLETLTKLEAASDAEHLSALTPLRQHLAVHQAEYLAPLESASADDARDRLDQIARQFAQTKFRAKGFAALAEGLEDSYRRGRKAFAKAYREPSDEAFHDLRKTVQWHWRQMSLVARLWPDAFAARISAARELSQILGDDHDLAMLARAARAVPGATDETVTSVEQLCLRQQQAMRSRAFHYAALLFAEKPKAFVARISAYWCAGRALGLLNTSRASSSKDNHGAVRDAGDPRDAAENEMS